MVVHSFPAAFVAGNTDYCVEIYFVLDMKKTKY